MVCEKPLTTSGTLGSVGRFLARPSFSIRVVP